MSPNRCDHALDRHTHRRLCVALRVQPPRCLLPQATRRQRHPGRLLRGDASADAEMGVARRGAWLFRQEGFATRRSGCGGLACCAAVPPHCRLLFLFGLRGFLTGRLRLCVCVLHVFPHRMFRNSCRHHRSFRSIQYFGPVALSRRRTEYMSLLQALLVLTSVVASPNHTLLHRQQVHISGRVFRTQGHASF